MNSNDLPPRIECTSLTSFKSMEKVSDSYDSKGIFGQILSDSVVLGTGTISGIVNSPIIINPGKAISGMCSSLWINEGDDDSILTLSDQEPDDTDDELHKSRPNYSKWLEISTQFSTFQNEQKPIDSKLEESYIELSCDFQRNKVVSIIQSQLDMPKANELHLPTILKICEEKKHLSAQIFLLEKQNKQNSIREVFDQKIDKILRKYNHITNSIIDSKTSSIGRTSQSRTNLIKKLIFVFQYLIKQLEIFEKKVDKDPNFTYEATIDFFMNLLVKINKKEQENVLLNCNFSKLNSFNLQSASMLQSVIYGIDNQAITDPQDEIVKMREVMNAGKLNICEKFQECLIQEDLKNFTEAKQGIRSSDTISHLKNLNIDRPEVFGQTRVIDLLKKKENDILEEPLIAKFILERLTLYTEMLHDITADGLANNYLDYHKIWAKGNSKGVQIKLDQNFSGDKKFMVFKHCGHSYWIDAKTYESSIKSSENREESKFIKCGKCEKKYGDEDIVDFFRKIQMAKIYTSSQVPSEIEVSDTINNQEKNSAHEQEQSIVSKRLDDFYKQKVFQKSDSSDLYL